MFPNSASDYFKNNPQYKTAPFIDAFIPCRFKERKLTGIVDDMARFIEKTQLLDEDKWKLFSDQFITRADSDNNGWRGEYWGKMMRGACITYSYTGNEKLYNIIEKTVCDILLTQDNLGRISTYSPDKEYHGWDLWCRKYIILGLLHFHEICKKDSLRKRIDIALENQLDYIISTVGNGKIPINETSDFWGSANSVSLLEPVVRMYNHTGNPQYLEFADYIVKTGTKDFDIFDAALKNEKAPYEWEITKAYELMSCFEGLIEYYRVTGIEKWKTAALNFVEALLKTDVSIIGCSGCKDELFDNSTATQTDPCYDKIMQETCVTVTWIKLCYQVLRLTGDARFADEIEKSVYNALYGSVNTEQTKLNGGFPFDSYSPLRLNKRGRSIGGKQYDINGNLIYGCCAAIGSAGTGIVPEIAASITERGIVLNLYINGEYKLVTPENKALRIDIKTFYPADGKIEISVFPEVCEEFEIMLRIPEFSQNTKLSVNGNSINANPGYIKILKCWHKDDKISLELDLHPRVIHPVGCHSDKNSLKFIAVKYGPLVLSRDSRLCSDTGKCVNLNYDENNEIRLIKNSNADFPVLSEFKAPCKNGNYISLIDYQSAGKTWNEDSETEVWLPTD